MCGGGGCNGVYHPHNWLHNRLLDASLYPSQINHSHDNAVLPCPCHWWEPTSLPEPQINNRIIQSWEMSCIIFFWRSQWSWSMYCNSIETENRNSLTLSSTSRLHSGLSFLIAVLRLADQSLHHVYYSHDTCLIAWLTKDGALMTSWLLDKLGI